MPTADPSDFFLTDYEFDKLIVGADDYLARLYLSADDSPAAVNGLQVIIVDTTGGPVKVTLENPVTAPAKYCPWIVNVGTGVVTVEATINGVVDPTIISQWHALAISIQTGGTYRAFLEVTV